MKLAEIVSHSIRLRSAKRQSPEERALARQKKLSPLLKHVWKYSPFYRKLYENHGLTYESLNVVKLEDLPFVDKDMIRDNFNEVVCDKNLKHDVLSRFIIDPANRDKLFLDKYTVIHTSGTTGSPAIFVYGPKEINLLSAVMFSRVNKLSNPTRRTRLLLLTAIEGKYAGVAISDNAPRFLYKKHKCSVNLSSEEIIATAQSFQPDVIGGYASAIHLLALEQLKGRINLHPKSIVCAGEALTAVARKDMAEAFGIEPTNFYASSESMAMAVECQSHRHMHLFDDLHYFESVDTDLNPVKPGKTGRLVLTNLYNYTLPLIRYRSTDCITLSPQACPCGSSLPILQSLTGRSEEYLWFETAQKSQEFIHPITFAEIFAPGLERFRVVQRSKREFVVQAQASQGRDEVRRIIHEQLDNILELKGLDQSVRYSVDFVEQLAAQSKSGKFDLIIPAKEPL